MKTIVNIILLVAPFGTAYLVWNAYGQTLGSATFILAGFIALIIRKNVERF